MGGKLDILVLRCHRLFKEGKFELARAKYEKVMKVLRKFNHVNPQDDDEGMEFAKTRNLLHLNVAACQLKLGECGKCIETCNKIMKLDKASETDATAALLKPQQKEQEVERKAWKQFKGLTDKKQGEIADAGDREDHNM